MFEFEVLESVPFLILIGLSLAGRSSPDSSKSPPPARMATRYRKWFFFLWFDVLDVEIRFGPDDARQLRRASEFGGTFRERAERVASAALSARDALLEIRFLRYLDLNLLIREIQQSSKRVHQAGLLDLEVYREICDNLPVWYSFLEKRGVRTDDRMTYTIQGDCFRVTYADREGRVLFDEVYEGPQHSVALLGAYFVPGSEFREPLIRSFETSE